MPSTNGPHYRRVSSTDLENSTEIGGTKLLERGSMRKCRIIPIVVVVVITIVATITTLVRVGNADVHLENTDEALLGTYPLNDCGTSAKEARERGCRFEIHNFAWVPPQCYDEELGRDWDSYTGWEFSWTANDSSATNKSFVEQCRAGNVEAAWVPWSQHMAHCSFILKKFLRSVMFNRPMDNWTSSWHHNEHCTNMMARPNVNPHLFNSLLHLKFPDCDYSWKTYRPASMEVKPTYHN